MKIVMFGSPGSGKGTQSALLSAHFGNIPPISTGGLLRSEVKKGTDLGRKINEIISKGGMVNDGLMEELLESRLGEVDCNSGFILDGFPRNVSQAVYLEELLARDNTKLDAVIVILVDNNLSLKRLSGRFQCVKCGRVYNKYFFNVKKDGICDDCGSTDFTVRSDDANEKIIKNRLEIYKKMSEPVIEFYEKKNLTYFVDGSKSPEEIYRDILNNFNKKFNNK
jgi:adenylate kinase